MVYSYSKANAHYAREFCAQDVSWHWNSLCLSLLRLDASTQLCSVCSCCASKGLLLVWKAYAYKTIHIIAIHIWLRITIHGSKVATHSLTRHDAFVLTQKIWETEEQVFAILLFSFSHCIRTTHLPQLNCSKVRCYLLVVIIALLVLYGMFANASQVIFIGSRSEIVKDGRTSDDGDTQTSTPTVEHERAGDSWRLRNGISIGFWSV